MKALASIGQSLSVPAVRLFDTLNWDLADEVLCDAPSLAFRQAWLSSARETFRPGFVRLGWQGASVIVSARLEDDCIVTRATEDGQRLWELGDVFEMFLRDADREDYLELHVTPCGRFSQLHFPSHETIAGLRNGVGSLDDFAVHEPLFDFRTRTDRGRWDVIARIPAASFGLNVASMKGRMAYASFSRYDHATGGAAPVLSSTSAHAKPDFHRQQEWTVLTFC